MWRYGVRCNARLTMRGAVPQWHHSPLLSSNRLASVLFLIAVSQAANLEFESKVHEAELRAQLTPHGRSRISYRCNRAVIFRSDQWHESEPFVFESGYTEVRAELPCATTWDQGIACIAAKSAPCAPVP